jgi:uncharacterized repeat protein (TIGR03803 family)
MRGFVVVVLLFFTVTGNVGAQTLYGTTHFGGANATGVISKVTVGTNDLTVLKSFGAYAGAPQRTRLLQASDGKFYGMSGSGSFIGIFSFDASTSTFVRLKDFSEFSGYPGGSLVEASNGKLYGVSMWGGAHGSGVIFSFDLSSLTLTTLKDFEDVDGTNPVSLMRAVDGKLYGVTSAGGSNNLGVIFSFDPATERFAKLFDFDETEGASSYGELIQAADGKLYGTTVSGGLNSNGIIFSFDASASSFAKLFDFNGAEGRNPVGSLVQATNGKLYGMCTAGGLFNDGVIFSFDPSSSIYTLVDNLGLTDASSPNGSLTQGIDGKLYGMTYAGGANNSGVVFSVDPLSSEYRKLKDLDYMSGDMPLGSLTEATNGTLYGMTSYGGGSDLGVIFSFNPVNGTYTKLKDISNNEIGGNPSAGLLKANDGKLYGMTTSGGSFGAGIIFSLDPVGQIFEKLFDFDIVNGANPYGCFIQATDGKLYGMTSAGGTSGMGVIFSFDPSSSVLVKLHDFDGVNGAHPYGNLMQATDGKFYGVVATVTNPCGRFDPCAGGMIFSFDPASSTFVKAKDFGASVDQSIGMIQGRDGKLYGMTRTNPGFLFSFDPFSNDLEKLKDFGGDDGVIPSGLLTQAQDGKLYGMTILGGASDAGVLFAFDPVSLAYIKLKDFGIEGTYPYGTLLQASDNKLYGTTISGGGGLQGIIFSFDPASSMYSTVAEYDGSNGAAPYIGSVLVEVSLLNPLPLTLLEFKGVNDGPVNKLTWRVTDDSQVDHYDLERSDDGLHFNRVAQIKSLGEIDHSFNDDIGTSSESIFYYQLKMVYLDGHIGYSDVIKIVRRVNGLLVHVSPNPFKNTLRITIQSHGSDKAVFTLTDIAGHKVLEQNDQLNAGGNIIEMKEAHRIPRGSYILTIKTSNSMQAFKVVKSN